MKQLSIKSPAASQLRQRKYALVRRFSIPEDLVGGSFVETHRRCGRANCHCASGVGHAQWTLTTSYLGKRRVERIPQDWVVDVERAVAKSQAYLSAVKELMAINIALLVMARTERQARKQAQKNSFTGKK
jgi:hypothetical protein